MLWTITYLPDCNADIRRMRSLDDAKIICAAVEVYVREGSGDVKQFAPGRFFIRSQAGFAILRVTESTKTVYVSRLIANDPLPYVEALLDEPEPPPSSEE